MKGFHRGIKKLIYYSASLLIWGGGGRISTGEVVKHPQHPFSLTRELFSEFVMSKSRLRLIHRNRVEMMSLGPFAVAKTQVTLTTIKTTVFLTLYVR
jgi:hypothetical protein